MNRFAALRLFSSRVKSSPKAPAPRTKKFNFKPVNSTNKSPKEPSNDVKNTVGMENIVNWRTTLGSIKVDDFEQNFLKKIINYTDTDKIDKLSLTKTDLLKNQIKFYDSIMGPDEDGNGKLNMPPDIRDGIIQCRDLEDWLNMVKIYDFYFHLINSVKNQDIIKDRLNTIKEMQTGDEEENLEVQEFCQVLKVCQETGLGFDLLENKWHAIEKPKNLKILSSGNYDLFVELLNNHFSKVNLRFINCILKDLIESDLTLNFDEYELLLRYLCMTNNNAKVYQEFKKSVVDNGILLIPKYYKILLQDCINRNDGKTFVEIFQDFEKDGYLVDRDIWLLLIEFEKLNKDISNLKKLIKFGIDDLKIIFFEKEFETIIRTFVNFGKIEFSLDILKSLIMLRNGKHEFIGEAKKDSEFKNLKGGMFDIDMVCIQNKEMLMTIPEITNGMITPILINSKGFTRLNEFLEILGFEDQQDSLITFDSELIKVCMLVISEDKTTKYKDVQSFFLKVFRKLDIAEIDKLVLDTEFIQALIKAIDQQLAIPDNSGLRDDDEFVAAYGQLVEIAELGHKAQSSGVTISGVNECADMSMGVGDLSEKKSQVLTNILTVCGIEV